MPSSRMVALFMLLAVMSFIVLPSCDAAVTISRSGATYSNTEEALIQAQDGDTLTLDAGAFTTPFQWSINKSVTIQGKGRDETSITFTGANWMSISASSVTLRDITFVGMVTPLDVSNTDMTIEQCAFRTSRGHQILQKVETPSSTGGALTISWSSFETLANAPPQLTDGGLMYLSLLTQRVVVSSTSFINGKGQRGGCLFVATAENSAHVDVTLDKVTMKGCVAQQDGGAVYVDLSNANAGSKLKISSSTLADNVAIGTGGAIFLEDVPATAPLAFTISGTRVANNIAVYGGALYISSAAYTTLQEITPHEGYNYFTGNKAVRDGGAIYVEATTVDRSLVCQTEFRDNSAGSDSAFTTIESKSDYPIALQSGNWQGGAIFIASPLDITSPQTVKIDFQQNDQHNAAGNTAPRGGFLATNSPIELLNLKTTGNTADTNGGGLYLSNSAKVTNSYLLYDEARKGAGGAVYISKGSFEMSNTLIKQAKSHGVGGGIAADQSVSSIKLTTYSFITKCASGGEGPAIHFQPPQTGNKYQKPLHAIVNVIIEDHSMIGHHDHPTSAAVVLYASSSELHYTSSNSEYKNNPKGHLHFKNSKYPSLDKKMVLTSGELDRFDSSPMDNNNGEYAIRWTNVVSSKSFTGTYFAGGCGGKGYFSSKAMLETCANSKYPTYSTAGWYGAWQNNWNRGCEEKTRSLYCGATTGLNIGSPSNRDMCSLGVSCKLLQRPDNIRSSRRYNKGAESFAIATTTSTTTTPAPTADPYPYCTAVEKRKYLGWIGITEESCRAAGHCWAPGAYWTTETCYAQKATGQHQYTPNTTCAVAEKDKILILRTQSRYMCDVYYHACWHSSESRGSYCFWPTNHVA